MATAEKIANVYLEGSVAEAFMHLAVSEGLAEYGYLDNVMEQILARYRASRMRNRALTATLLYDRLHVVEYLDSFDLKELGRAGIVAESKPAESPARRGSGSWPRGATLFSSEQLDVLLSVRNALLPYLRRHRIFNAAALDHGVELLKDPDFLYHESRKCRRSNVISPDMFLVMEFERVLLPLVELLRNMNGTKSAIETTKIGSPGSFHLETVTTVNPRSLYRSYAILLEEITAFPKPRSLNEAIEIRNDRRIVEFRNNLWHWAEVIQAEDAGGERRLRKELQSASKSLQSFPRLRRVSLFLTYLSLPVAFVPFLGLPIAALGVAIQTYSDAKARKLRWLMVNV
ncbi:MAG: hypothetical protein ACREU9_04825 [Gammaproteobacteria bacterium]